jgi:hypothetical protein
MRAARYVMRQLQCTQTHANMLAADDVGCFTTLYCPQDDRAGTDVQTHRNATKAPLNGKRSTKYISYLYLGTLTSLSVSTSLVDYVFDIRRAAGLAADEAEAATKTKNPILAPNT